MRLSLPSSPDLSITAFSALGFQPAQSALLFCCFLGLGFRSSWMHVHASATELSPGSSTRCFTETNTFSSLFPCLNSHCLKK